MNRFRTGRGAPPWAWMQTGPLTVDVEACMSNKDRGEAKYISPLNVRHEYVPPAAPADKPTENTQASPSPRSNLSTPRPPWRRLRSAPALSHPNKSNPQQKPSLLTRIEICSPASLHSEPPETSSKSDGLRTGNRPQSNAAPKQSPQNENANHLLPALLSVPQLPENHVGREPRPQLT